MNRREELWTVGTDLLRLNELELHATPGPGDEVAISWVIQ